MDSANLSLVIPEELALLLREQIVYGRLVPMTRLTEDELAKAYGVSRSPVREALRILERDGLVLKEPRRGIWVAPMTLSDFDEVYACRIPLEALAAAEAARSTDEALKGELPAILRTMRAAHLDGDVQSFFDADVRGSVIIYRLCGNATLCRLLASLEKQALRYRYFAYARETDIVRLSVEGTATIYDAILASDAAHAKAETEGLIGTIWREIRLVVAAALPGD
jgi:DNA-binding GntR family transcriptional regulator